MPPKKTIFALLALFLFTHAIAQEVTLKGRVTDATGMPLAAEVLVTTQADSVIKTGYFENGQILLPGIPFRSFRVTISAFNHADTSILVNNARTETDLGAIVLSRVKKLEGVTVKAKAPLFRKTTEGTRVNVENTLLGASVSAAEVLSKSPGLTVNKTNITVFGKGEAIIYLNGKPITYEMMQSIPVNRIKSVDIITNPSAKYESKGMAVINIITKKGQGPEGFVGELTQSATFARHYINDAALNLNFKKKKVSLTADYSSQQGTDWLKGSTERTYSYSFGKYITRGTQEENTYNAMNIYRAGLNYEINRNSDLSIQYDGLYNEYDLGVDIRNRVLDTANNPTQITVYNNGFSGNYNNSVNANYNRTLDSLGSTLFIGAQYSRFHTVLYDQIRETVSEPALPDTLNFRVNDGDNVFKLRTLQADLVKMLRNGGKIEAGVRMSHITNEGRVIFKSKADGEKDYTVFPQFSNSNIYTEKVPAAYIQYHGNLGEKWAYSAGLRTEHSRVTAFSRALNKQIVNDRYTNFFPNARINYTISGNWSASVSYSGRINRPIYQNIDPFVWYLDKFTSVQGNPLLKPELVYSTEAVLGWKKYSFKLGYSRTKSTLQGVAIPGTNGNNSAILTMLNLEKLELYNASLELPIEKGGFSSYNNFSLNLEKITDSRYPEFGAMGITPQFYFYTYNQLNIPKVAAVDLTAQYFSPKKNGLLNAGALYYLSWGMSRSFLNNKLSVRLLLNDFLRSYRFIGTRTQGHISTHFDGVINSHYLRLTLKYKFGGLKNVTYKNRSVNDDEFNRIRQ